MTLPVATSVRDRKRVLFVMIVLGLCGLMGWSSLLDFVASGASGNARYGSALWWMLVPIVLAAKAAQWSGLLALACDVRGREVRSWLAGGGAGLSLSARDLVQ